ncbi:MAG: hypothetical protein QOF57_1323 [Frankiaceae bacterium]|nr:hypothetical protein [Frankiaceae bacterium]
MRLLVLGGTSFVGRAIVEDALAHGHDVTVFSRGVTGAELFPGVERRRGDRTAGEYASLAGGEWDAVVDVSAYVPRHVAEALTAVDGRFGRYVFISTVSVYDNGKPQSPVRDEDSPRLAPVRASEEVTGDTYGGLKVACEDDVLAGLGDRATIVRPGVVAGPHDTTDRFTWWVRAAAAGGAVEIPGRPDQPAQVIDSRDLARLVVRLAEDDVAGTFNAVGPADATTLGGLLATCAAAAGTEAEFVSVPGGGRHPLVLADPKGDVMFRRSSALARAAGLPATPLERTAADVLAWDRERGLPPLLVP